MVFRPFRDYRLLLLALIFLTSSCRTTSAPEAPNPELEQEGKPAQHSTLPSSEVAELQKPEPDTTAKPPLVQPVIRELPESILGAPEKDLASPMLHYDSTVRMRASNTPTYATWQYRQNSQGKIVGFEFSNRGGNRILPHSYDITKNQLFTRDFQFHFDDRARQDIYLFVTDWAPSRDKQFRLSELLNTILLFFPRTYLPAIVRWKERSLVTLPTGEEVEFDMKSNEIIGGVLAESPVDLNPDRMQRKFPGIDYSGKGVVVRTNSRGADPRLATLATITTGSPAADCTRGTACYQCQVLSRDLWQQKGPLRFKFSTDDAFDRFLTARCGFGIPKSKSELIIGSAQQSASK